eukprot:416362_1
MSITFTNEEIKILIGKNIEKQKKLAKIKMDQFEGSNIEDFFWMWINAGNKYRNKTDILKVNKRPKDDIDEKQLENDINKTNSLSMLIDFQSANNTKTSAIYTATTGHGMCNKGDVWFDKDGTVCMECGSGKNVMKCHDCNSRDNVRCTLCKRCRFMNFNTLAYESKVDNIKRAVIRAELSIKPSLSLDVLCGLPRKMGLDKLMEDIMRLDEDDRSQYVVFLVDMDNLKALNSILSHQGADEVIKNVGIVLKKWCLKIKKGKFQKLENAFCFRQGGDE